MSNSEIVQSYGIEISDSHVTETNPVGENFSEVFDITPYCTHSYHFTVKSLDSELLSCSVIVQVSNIENPSNEEWIDLFRTDISHADLEIFHYKDIFNFVKTRVKFLGKGDFKLNESHTPLYRNMLDLYGIVYAPCSQIEGMEGALEEILETQKPHKAVEDFAKLLFPSFDQETQTLKSLLYDAAVLMIQKTNYDLYQDLPYSGSRYE